MPKLRIAIGVIGTLLGFAIALQAIVQVVKNLRDLHVTDGMFLLVKFPGNRPRALTNPSQRRLRVPARLRIDQPFQRLHQVRIGLRDGLASRPGPTNAAHQRPAPSLDFANTLGDGLARQATGAPHQRNSSIAQAHGFIGGHDAARAFIQMWPNRTKLPLQFGQGVHVCEA